MAIIVSNEGSYERVPIPTGTHAARCVGMVEIGTVTTEWEGKEKQQRKVRLTWELVNEQKTYEDKEGKEVTKNHIISKTYTALLSDKSKLREHLNSWRGKPFTEEEAKAFDITKVLGHACILTIIDHTSKAGKTSQVISGIGSTMKGMTVPEAENPIVELNYAEFDPAIFAGLPDFIKDDMRKTPEFEEIKHLIEEAEEKQIIEEATAAESETSEEPPF